MSSKTQKWLTKISRILALIVIPLSLVLGYFIYTHIFGNPANFEGNNPLNEPLRDNYLGLIYKGGSIVSLQLALMIILLTYTVERLIVLTKAKGKTNNADFVQSIKYSMTVGNTAAALQSCDSNRGAVANVIKNGLNTFDVVLADKSKTQSQKVLELQKDLEEATHLELPELNRNMVIISTIASIATLIGLLGTVTGMIVAFSALARVGAPDAVGLAAGISQALITTALGISTSAAAIVIFNSFSSTIDRITQHIDEATFTLVNALKLKQ